MSGMPGPYWERDDQLTFGEGVARCDHPDCHAPLELYLRATLVLERCQHFKHIAHAQGVFARSWFGED